jgi:hypothetical protein
MMMCFPLFFMNNLLLNGCFMRNIRRILVNLLILDSTTQIYVFDEYKVEEDVQISVSSFTKISNNDMSIYDHHDTESELGIEEKISKVESSETVVGAPVYDNYESSDEEFQTDVLLPVVLKDIELDHNEQELVEIFQCDESFVLPPFSSSESQAEKSKSILEQFSQIHHEEGTSIFVEQSVIPHIFHDLVAFWLESTLSQVSYDLGYMKLMFLDHEYELHRLYHVAVSTPNCPYFAKVHTRSSSM